MSEYDPNFKPQKVYALVGQKAIIINVNHEILVLQRSEKSGLGGKWSLPGGGLDKGEDATEGIRREILEETGLQAHNLKPFTVRSRMVNDEDFAVLIGYASETDSDAITLNWEHDDYRWTSKDNALQLNLTDDARHLINQWQI